MNFVEEIALIENNFDAFIRESGMYKAGVVNWNFLMPINIELKHRLCQLILQVAINLTDAIKPYQCNQTLPKVINLTNTNKPYHIKQTKQKYTRLTYIYKSIPFEHN